jgi:hypothetical protein
MKEIRIFISDGLEPDKLLQVSDSVEKVVAVHYDDEGLRYEEHIPLNENLTIDWQSHWDHLEVPSLLELVHR